MGVDFENRGERVYRLLGCDLTYTDHLPKVGDVLVHDIVIDGFATAAISATSEARIYGVVGPPSRPGSGRRGLERRGHTPHQANEDWQSDRGFALGHGVAESE